VVGLLFIARRQKRRTQLLYLNSKMRHEQVMLEKKAIEVARTRLRKKLNLTNSNISLHDFLASLGEAALEEHTFTKAISQKKS
jgi:DNA-binding response OmpR family regulator